MDGVRRWIGQTPQPAGTRKTADKRTTRHNEADRDGTGTVKEDLDPQSMEAIVEGLLSPTVHEEAEYQLSVSYHEQTDHLLTTLLPVKVYRTTADLAHSFRVFGR